MLRCVVFGDMVLTIRELSFKKGYQGRRALQMNKLGSLLVFSYFVLWSLQPPVATGQALSAREVEEVSKTLLKIHELMEPPIIKADCEDIKELIASLPEEILENREVHSCMHLMHNDNSSTISSARDPIREWGFDGAFGFNFANNNNASYLGDHFANFRYRYGFFRQNTETLGQALAWTEGFTLLINGEEARATGMNIGIKDTVTGEEVSLVEVTALDYKKMQFLLELYTQTAFSDSPYRWEFGASIGIEDRSVWIPGHILGDQGAFLNSTNMLIAVGTGLDVVIASSRDFELSWESHLRLNFHDDFVPRLPDNNIYGASFSYGNFEPIYTTGLSLRIFH